MNEIVKTLEVAFRCFGLALESFFELLALVLESRPDVTIVSRDYHGRKRVVKKYYR